MTIIPHCAVNGVTGSCHELVYKPNASVLTDCGLFQRAETSGSGANTNKLTIDFSIGAVKALVVCWMALGWRGVLAPHFAPTSILANTAFWTERPCPVVYDRIHAE